MKKLLALLLSLVMLCTLTIPAFADSPVPGAAPYGQDGETADSIPISPVPDAQWDNDWAKAQWAETCKEEPELTAQFLAELDSWFAEEYNWYVSFDEYSKYYNCPEEAYQDLFQDWSWNYIRQRERDAFITAHGGVPGQLNVMVNGTFLTSPEERPVYVDNGVTYVDAQALSQALGIPVAANESGYAPLRATAEAAGCSVFWDSTYNAAVVIDPTALAAKIDSSFTILNRMMENETRVQSNSLIKGRSDAELTLFDSLNGDQTKQFFYDYDFTTSTAGISGKVNYDFSSLNDLLQQYIAILLNNQLQNYYLPQDEGLHQKYYEQQEALLTAMISGSIEIRADLDNQMAYLSIPSMMPKAWFSIPLDELDMETLNQQLSRTVTVGQLICDAAMDSYDSAGIYDSAMDSAAQAAALVGDEKFARKGNAYELTLTADDIKSIMEDEYTGTSFSVFSLNLYISDNGDLNIDMQCRLAMNSGGLNLGDVLQFSINGSKTGGKAQMTTEFHLRNVLKLTVKQQQNLTSTQKGPTLTPPKGALILDIQEMSKLGF